MRPGGRRRRRRERRRGQVLVEALRYIYEQSLLPLILFWANRRNKYSFYGLSGDIVNVII